MPADWKSAIQQVGNLRYVEIFHLADDDSCVLEDGEFFAPLEDFAEVEVGDDEAFFLAAVGDDDAVGIDDHRAARIKVAGVGAATIDADDVGLVLDGAGL